MFNEKMGFNIEKIAKNRKIPKKIPKKFENAQKVNFSGHWQGGNLKNSIKKFIWGPPKMIFSIEFLVCLWMDIIV